MPLQPWLFGQASLATDTGPVLWQSAVDCWLLWIFLHPVVSQSRTIQGPDHPTTDSGSPLDIASQKYPVVSQLVRSSPVCHRSRRCQRLWLLHFEFLGKLHRFPHLGMGPVWGQEQWASQSPVTHSKSRRSRPCLQNLHSSFHLRSQTKVCYPNSKFHIQDLKFLLVLLRPCQPWVWCWSSQLHSTRLQVRREQKSLEPISFWVFSYERANPAAPRLSYQYFC